MKHHAHLLEDRLFDCYVAARNSEAVDPRLAEHLADCEPCAARYADLAAFMDTLYSEAEADADAVFTPERLRAQQQQIARRLEHLAHPARVISFPSRIVRRTMAASVSRVAPRWIAGAAAAGLLVGLVAGASYQLGSRGVRTSDVALHQTASPRLTTVATRGSSAAQSAADDAFLSDLEIALERPHTRELVAFDALTPHVREVGLTR